MPQQSGVRYIICTAAAVCSLHAWQHTYINHGIMLHIAENVHTIYGMCVNTHCQHSGIDIVCSIVGLSSGNVDVVG